MAEVSPQIASTLQRSEEVLESRAGGHLVGELQAGAED